MDIDYRWVVDEVTDGYRWVSYAGRRNRHVVESLADLWLWLSKATLDISALI